MYYYLIIPIDLRIEELESFSSSIAIEEIHLVTTCFLFQSKLEQKIRSRMLRDLPVKTLIAILSVYVVRFSKAAIPLVDEWSLLSFFSSWHA